MTVKSTLRSAAMICLAAAVAFGGSSWLTNNSTESQEVAGRYHLRTRTQNFYKRASRSHRVSTPVYQRISTPPVRRTHSAMTSSSLFLFLRG